MKFSMNDVERMKESGKIKGFTQNNRTNIPHSTIKNIPQQNNQRAFQEKSKSKAKEWLSWNLPFWCNENSVSLETEYVFHPARKWRFDYAIPSLKIAVEYEGIFSDKSRHTTFSGYNADTDKYNTAAAMGWRVIRLTAKNYLNLFVFLKQIQSNDNSNGI
jgi:hypothetical protein